MRADDESPLVVPEAHSAFHPRAQRNASRHRGASTIQIVRPSESTAETQPKLQPALLRLSAMISQYFTRRHYGRLRLAGDVIETHEHKGDFKAIKLCRAIIRTRDQ